MGIGYPTFPQKTLSQLTKSLPGGLTEHLGPWAQPLWVFHQREEGGWGDEHQPPLFWSSYVFMFCHMVRLSAYGDFSAKAPGFRATRSTGSIQQQGPHTACLTHLCSRVWALGLHTGPQSPDAERG